MKTAVRTFGKTESGAVTVDWLVLTAALIGLGMLVLIPAAYSTSSATRSVSDYISNIEPRYDYN